MEMFIERINQQNSTVRQEMLSIQEEIERAEDQGLQRYDLRKKLIDLKSELEQNQKLLEKFNPGKSAVNL